MSSHSGPEPVELVEGPSVEARCQALATRSAGLDPGPEQLDSWIAAARRTVDRHVAAGAGRPYTRPGNLSQGFAAVPETGREVSGVCSELAVALSDGVATTSGRYLGYIPAGGLPSGAVADYLAAGMNPYAALSCVSPGAAAIENAVADWLCGVVGLPGTAGAVLTSGGTTAALTALVAARDAHGVLAGGPRDAVVYSTSQAHLSLRRALHVAGCGAVDVRTIPTDDEHRMRVDVLEAAVRVDLAAGRRPWVIAATAGTTNTGAVDPLDAIADVAARYGLWFHVDGAYGGLFALSPLGRPVLAGISRADSVVLDPHKTLFLPYGVGAVAVADRRHLTGSFATAAEYLPDTAAVDPADLGPELTRPFRGLRVWLSLQLAGRAAFEAALTEKLLLARVAYARLSAVRGVLLGPEPRLSLFVFRVDDAHGGDGATARLVERMALDRIAFCSTTRLQGRLWARVAIGSFRTHLEHVTDLCDAVAEGVAAGQRDLS